MIDMPEFWWDKQISANKVAKFFQQNRLEHEEKLDIIFEKQEPVNVGPKAPGGHEGGNAGVPTQHVDSDHTYDSEDELPGELPSPPRSHHVRTNSMTSASSGKRHYSDPMVSSAHFWDGFKNYYKDVSACKKQKQSESSSKVAEDDTEYEALMTELLHGGVDPASEEYFMATVVLEDMHRRCAYRPLPTIEAKRAWIKRMFNFITGQPPSS